MPFEASREVEQTNVESATNPIFQPDRPTKIIVAPGPGAGWVSFAPRNAPDAFLIWMLTYKPIIEALERREHKEKLEEVLREFHKKAHEKFNIDRLMTPRVTNLVVQEVAVPFEIRENEGNEKIWEVNRRRTIRLIL